MQNYQCNGQTDGHSFLSASSLELDLLQTNGQTDKIKRIKWIKLHEVNATHCKWHFIETFDLCTYSHESN